MDITQALKKHHDILRDMLKKAEKDPEVFSEALAHLVAHHTLEEKYFYDHITEGTMRHDALEAVNEHHIIELIIKDAEDFPRDHERYAIKVEGLREYTGHHLDEEEEDVFPDSKKILDDAKREELGTAFNTALEQRLACAKA